MLGRSEQPRDRTRTLAGPALRSLAGRQSENELGKAVEGEYGAGSGWLPSHRDSGTEKHETLGHVELQVPAHANQADQTSLEIREQEGADRNRGGDRGYAPGRAGPGSPPASARPPNEIAAA